MLLPPGTVKLVNSACNDIYSDLYSFAEILEACVRNK